MVTSGFRIRCTLSIPNIGFQMAIPQPEKLIGNPLASADGDAKIGKVRMLRVHKEG